MEAASPLRPKGVHFRRVSGGIRWLPMPVIPEGYAQVVARISQSGVSREMAVVFGVESVGAFTQGDIDGISAAASDFIRGITTNTTTYIGVKVTEEQGSGPILWESVVDAGLGANTGATAPPNTAWLIRKRTGSGGRRGRGRMFVPGIRETDVDQAGVITAAQVTGAQALATAFGNALTTNATPMVLLHSEAPFTPELVTALTVDSRVATQRRRLRG